MNKILKGCLILITIIFFIVVLLALYLFFSMSYMSNQAETDEVEQTAICDSVPYITERPELSFSGFEINEIDTLHFRILREGNFIGDTILCHPFTYISSNGKYMSMKIPYDHFLKTDTIVVVTKQPLYYKISGFYHYAYLHYGMFGYLGSHDCRLSKKCMINNIETSWSIYKDEGWESIN